MLSRYSRLQKLASLSLLTLSFYGANFYGETSFRQGLSTAVQAQTTIAGTDLIVTNVKVVQSSFQVGSSIQFAITVKNQGTTATPTTWIGHSFYVDGVKVDWAGQTTSIAPGASQTFTSQGWIATKTSFTLKASADDANNVPEANETNNSMTIQVGSSTTPTINGTDLTVTGLKVVQSSFQVGNWIQFAVTVKNQGTTATPTTWIGHSFYVDGVKVDWAGQTVSIAPGASQTFTSQGWTATKTNFTLKVVADDGNSVPEVDKTNNTLSVQVGSTTPSSSTPVPNAPLSGYNLVFQDEFDGTSLDTTKWMDQWPWGRTNSTHYLTYYAPDAFAFSNGQLHIKQEKRSMNGYQYTSGVISTYSHKTWQYGYFEMRAKLPTGRGMWPGFWLVPTSQWPPEIDIFEMLGQEPNKLYMTNHWTDTSGNPTGYSFPYVGPDFSKDYHIYGMEWTPSSITFYVDGNAVYKTTEHVPQLQMYLLADVSVGGEWAGPPDASTVFPQTMDIDYIRVFQKP